MHLTICRYQWNDVDTVLRLLGPSISLRLGYVIAYSTPSPNSGDASLESRAFSEFPLNEPNSDGS
jgi:hypothetical protein